jgi:hypothetical protein
MRLQGNHIKDNPLTCIALQLVVVVNIIVSFKHNIFCFLEISKEEYKFAYD